MLTGEVYHRIVQIIPKLVSNFVINRSKHARYLVCYPLDVMYVMKRTYCRKGLVDNLNEDKTIHMEKGWPKNIEDIIFTLS